MKSSYFITKSYFSKPGRLVPRHRSTRPVLEVHDPLREPMDAFYGDRSAGVTDAFGNSWWIATYQEDVSREELERRAEAQRKK